MCISCSDTFLCEGLGSNWSTHQKKCARASPRVSDPHYCALPPLCVLRRARLRHATLRCYLLPCVIYHGGRARKYLGGARGTLGTTWKQWGGENGRVQHTLAAPPWEYKSERSS